MKGNLCQSAMRFESGVMQRLSIGGVSVDVLTFGLPRKRQIEDVRHGTRWN